MRKTIFSLLICLGLLSQLVSSGQQATSLEQRKIFFNNEWKFFPGDPADGAINDFDDHAWRQIDLPHDWSIEGKIAVDNPTGGAGGFVPAGIGWYRKTFFAPKEWVGKKVIVEFEGVYMNADIWLNGKKIENHPYGYTGFLVDLTNYIKPGSNNVLAVRVDNSQQENSRWYSGSGIYRHVWLMVVNPVHVAPWGVFVSTTEANSSVGKIHIQTEIKGDYISKQPVILNTELIGPNGSKLGEISDKLPAIKGGTKISQNIVIPNPPLWTPEKPLICKVITEISIGGKIVDRVETSFGIRTLSWSVEKGIQVNGQTIKLSGGCIHHDNGCLGAAAFDRAEERKIELLKSAGFNAIRTAHNPPSPALLDACDRLGVMVMEEAFDCWEKAKTKFDYALVFNDWWEKDIDAMVMRDRNHPSVIMWSIGNEIPDQSTERVADLSKLLADRIRNLDTSRPVTEGIHDKTASPGKQDIHNRSCTALDIVGYNYGREMLEKEHARIPSRIIVITESVLNETFKCWEISMKHSYILGDFIWTAMDYLGENGIGRWQYDSIPTGHGTKNLFPWHSAYCGDIDITGFRKPISHYRNIIWNRGEKLFIAVQQPAFAGHKIFMQFWAVHPSLNSWTWPGFENKPVKVEVYSRCDSVLLYQDDRLIRRKPTTQKDQFKATFELTYAPGILKAVGYNNGKPTEEEILKTAGAATSVRLIPDRTELQADGQDLSFINVELVDKNGVVQTNYDQEITFTIGGAGVIAGVANADMTSLEPYQGNKRKTYQGRALVVIRTHKQGGLISLNASANGLTDGIIQLSSAKK